ncbi:MAG: hypothetical protein A4E66_00676 [Syntrophus sp. PtaB.Bin001]|nr:MAG: hypothetical protein A4E66_00676 [Syntrophus sp. PtaB.Bin001]
MGELNGEQNIKCPSCGGDRRERYGKTKAGLQKYRCLNQKCRRQFVAGSAHRIDPKVKEIVIGLLRQNIPPATIAKSVSGISLRRIRELRQELTVL